jgi:hypothetical protein
LEEFFNTVLPWMPLLIKKTLESHIMTALESMVCLFPCMLVVITEIFEDIAVYIVEDTERDAAEGADGVSIIKASPIGKEIPTSYTARPNVRTNGRAPDRGHEIIWALPPDDEHADADAEGDEEKFSSVLPLGTSDLDIRDDWYTTSGRKDADYTSEEDELEEMEFTQTADDVAKSAVLELSQSPETVVPSSLNGT